MQKHLPTVFAAMLAAIILLAGYIYAKPADVPKTPSYQTQNLEALQSAQPKDLLLCETQDGSRPKIRRAFLVDKNDGERLIGTVLEQRIAIRTETDGLPILAVSSWQCKFRTIKNAGSENEIVTIILHGPNKLAEVN